MPAQRDGRIVNSEHDEKTLAASRPRKYALLVSDGRISSLHQVTGSDGKVQGTRGLGRPQLHATDCNKCPKMPMVS